MDFPNLTGAKYVVIDLETRDPDIKSSPGWATGNGSIAGVAVCVEGAVSQYCTDIQSVLRWLSEGIFSQDIRVIGHNLQYDLGWLAQAGIKFGNARFACTQLSAALLDEDRESYALNSLGKDWLGETKAEEGLIAYAKEHGLDPKADIWQMPESVVAPYAIQDVMLTARLWEHERKRLEADNCMAIAELEFALIPLFIEMRMRGVRIDLDALEQADSELKARETALLGEIEARYGVQVSPWAARSVAKLCDKIGLKYPLTAGPKPMPSYKSEWINHPEQHEALKLVGRARKVSKARNTFIKAYGTHNHNGRIHCQWHQLRSDEGGTISGRLSCSDPNLQQVPHRDPDLAPIIRRLFLPDDGAQWLSNDYSQQEPRLTVHYAHLLRLQGAAEAVRQFREDPRTDFHSMVADITGLPRGTAKNINLGLIYGMGKKKFAQKYGFTEAKAAEMMETYHERLPFMKQLAQICSNKAAAKGRINTILGRPCRFELWEPVNGQRMGVVPCAKDIAEAVWMKQPLKRAFGHTALNRLVQGGAADQTKQAMLMMYQEGIVPMLQIHDEVCISGDEAMAQRAAEIMREAIQMEVPSVVDTAIGTNWATAE